MFRSPLYFLCLCIPKNINKIISRKYKIKKQKINKIDKNRVIINHRENNYLTFSLKITPRLPAEYSRRNQNLKRIFKERLQSNKIYI